MIISEDDIKFKLRREDGKLRSAYNKILTVEEYEYIKNKFKEIESFSDAIKIFFYLGEYKKCTICNNNVLQWSVRDTCSKACAKRKREQTNLDKYGTKSHLSNKDIRTRIEQTNFDKYGGKTPANSKEVVDKTKQTIMKKYGTDYYFNSTDYKEKSERTNLEKYGTKVYVDSDDFKNKKKVTIKDKYNVENVSQIDSVKQKVKQTNFEKYGSEHYLSSDDCKNKSKQTNLERYGYENAILNDDIKNKRNRTNLERYGYENAILNDDIKNKRNRTNFERYGCKSVFGSKYYSDIRLDKLKNVIKLKTGIDVDLDIIKQLKLDINREYSTEYLKSIISYYSKEEKIDMNILRNEFSITTYGVKRKDMGLTTDRSISSYEHDLCTWLENFDINMVRSDRNSIAPYELDIFIPDHNIAIEFNGSYWHSDLFKDKYYHQMKTKMCNELGITLIHIHEYLFEYKADVYRSIIKSKLGLNERVYARKCELKEVPKQQEKDFLNNYHLQGFVGSSKCYGLYHNDELLTLCSFGKSRFNKDYEYELLRNCTKSGITVVGGLSKILKHYKNEIDNNSIICYSDASISYNKNNKLTSPNYVWIKNNLVLTRYQTMKHKLPQLLGDSFDPQLSEEQNMKNNKYLKVYDSGNYIEIL